MRAKHFLIYGAVLLALTNLAVIFTLLLAGHFSLEGKSGKPLEEAAPVFHPPAEVYEPTPVYLVRDLHAATLICNDKLYAAKGQIITSHEIDFRASYFDSNRDGGAYVVVYNMDVIDVGTSEELQLNITCEVSAALAQIIGYKILPLDD